MGSQEGTGIGQQERQQKRHMGTFKTGLGDGKTCKVHTATLGQITELCKHQGLWTLLQALGSPWKSFGQKVTWFKHSSEEIAGLWTVRKWFENSSFKKNTKHTVMHFVLGCSNKLPFHITFFCKFIFNLFQKHLLRAFNSCLAHSFQCLK